MTNDYISIYTIELPSEVEEKNFETIMLEEVFPALLSKGPTRRGQVNMLRLFKGNTEGQTNKYVWMAGGVMGGVANEKEVTDTFTALGVLAAEVGIGDLHEIGREPREEELVRRLFEEVWNQNNLSVAPKVIHGEYSSAENLTFASERGPKVLAAEVAFYRSQYSDLTFTIEHAFTEGDTVVTRWRASGVANDATFINRAGELVNKSLQAEGMSLCRVVDGKIITCRLYWPRDPLIP